MVQRTPQEFPGPALEDAICFYDQYGVIPDCVGSMWYSDGYLYIKDSYGTFNARVGGSGLDENQHKSLRQLIHFINDGPGDGFGIGPYYCETSYVNSVFPINETWYESSSKEKKIFRWEGTYNENKTFATEKWIIYDTDGVSPKTEATDTISYSGILEINRSRTIVVY